jgi:ABC-type sugar transport system ATPase subunit
MTPVLKIESLSKHFGGTQALDGVDFELGQNEIHALVGENGAGKSTLVNILSGTHAPDSGRIVMNHGEVRIDGPTHARQLGIAVIYQDFDLAPNLSIADNLLLDREPAGLFGIIDGAEHARLAVNCLRKFGIAIAPDTPVGELTVAQQQLVAIAKAVSQETRILIMDEPTSALASDEIDRLLALMLDLKAAGTSIIFISHKLDEVFRVSDRITVLRNGRSVGVSTTGDTTVDALVSMMVGRNVTDLYTRAAQSTAAGPALEVRGLACAGSFAAVSFGLAKGEVLGLYGLKGAGRTAIAETLFGLADADGGELMLDGEPVNISRPADAIRLGIGFVPEDRKKEALFPNMDVKENLSITVLCDFSRHGIIDRASERQSVTMQLESLNIRTSGPDQMIGDLSGGNQQKVVLCRWLAGKPKFLILDEPTAGIDIGAKAEIYKLIDRLVAEGTGILLISSELPEILGLSDRILVVAGGRIRAEFSRSQATEEKIMQAIHSVEPSVAAI